MPQQWCPTSHKKAGASTHWLERAGQAKHENETKQQQPEQKQRTTTAKYAAATTTTKPAWTTRHDRHDSKQTSKGGQFFPM